MPYIRKTTLYVGILICILMVVLTVVKQAETSTKEKQTGISGALESLQFFGLARAYPNAELPESGYYSAWETLKKSDQDSKSSPESIWKSIGPDNFGGRTLTLAFNPQNAKTIYAGSASGGLWRSYSGGVGATTWHYVSTGFPVLGVSSIAIPTDDSLTIYIGTGEVYNSNAAGTGAAYRSTRGSYGIGILKSIDGGRSWQKSLDWSSHQTRGIWDVKISNQNQATVFAATTHGVYKSTDAGANWSQVLNVAMSNSLVIHPDNDNVVLVGCGNFGSPGHGIYKSLDGGQTWNQIKSDLPGTFNGKVQLALAPSDHDLVYASVGNGFDFDNGATWVCRSRDFGTTWETTGTTDYSLWQGWFSHDIAVHPDDPDRIITAGISVWRSGDGGDNLEEISVNGLGFPSPPIEGPDGPPDYVHSDIHDLIFHPDNPDIFYIASDGGIYQTTDNGASFRSRNGGYQSVQFYNGTSISRTRPDIFIGGLQDNGTIAYYGTSQWSRLTGGDGSWSAIDPLRDHIIYTSSQRLNLRKSIDGGVNFETISPPENNEFSAFISPFVISRHHPNIMYAGRERVYKTIDGGANWASTNAGNPLNTNNPILSMAISPQNSQVLYVATAPTSIFGGTRGQVFRTDNGGFSWNNITGALPDRFPMDLAVDPHNDATAYIVFSGFGTGHLYKTTDYGKTWKSIGAGLPDVPTNAVVIDPRSSQIIYVGNDLGVFVSEDGGDTWKSFNEGLYEAVMVFDLIISPTDRKLILASHGNGAFERDLIEVPSILQGDENLTMRVYQNPTHATLDIAYKMRVAGPLRASLIDIMGRNVVTFLDKTAFSGEDTYSLFVDDIPTGIYLIRMDNGEMSLTEKVLIFD